MAKGISINIGLNSINQAHYTVEGRLKGCENDARLMAEIAKSRNFEVKKIIGNEATTTNVINEIAKASETLGDKDMLLITYSGHGGQMKDTNKNEPDGLDETWCLFDRQMIDDEMFELWTRFKEGVRILVFSDSCHSGTVTGSISSGFETTAPDDDKTLPQTVLEEVFNENETQYEAIQREVNKKLTLGQTRDFRELVDASVLLISACQDWQLAKDGEVNGLFTNALKEVWDGGSFGGNYIQFHEMIWKKIQKKQSPNYYKLGIPNSAFEMQGVFTID